MGVKETVFADLRSLVADLAKGGGLMSASIYDTAQVLRFAPISVETEPAYDWLLSQQRNDGGWGSAIAPRARDAPTLAAILALHGKQDIRARESVRAGLDFLAKQAPHWEQLSDDLPVAVELTVPTLLEDARKLGLSVPDSHYVSLLDLGTARRHLLSRINVSAGSPAAHCWETWGTVPDPGLLSEEAGVGVSCAATAAWLREAQRHPDLIEHRAIARRYLERAQQAVGLGIPGVVPGIWPMERMEQQWGLYALLCSGLLLHPQLTDVVEAQADDLQQALRPDGLGFSSFFAPDGDCTAVTLAVLHCLGRSADPKLLAPYARDDHFITYPGERNFSYSATAHGTRALSLMGKDIARWSSYLVKKQGKDGWWPQDKWHMSRFYTTTRVMLALESTSNVSALRAALDAVLKAQRPEGGWGTFGQPTRLETGYVVIALEMFRRRGIEVEDVRRAQRRAYDWLLRQYKPYDTDYEQYEKLWIGKELYCPPRMDRPYELSALALLTVADAEGRL